MSRTVWHIVADLNNPTAEPFMVLRVDTSVRRESGVEGTVVSFHWMREEAERAAHDLDDCPICLEEGFKGIEGCDHTVTERAKYFR